MQSVDATVKALADAVPATAGAPTIPAAPGAPTVSAAPTVVPISSVPTVGQINSSVTSVPSVTGGSCPASVTASTPTPLPAVKPQ